MKLPKGWKWESVAFTGATASGYVAKATTSPSYPMMQGFVSTYTTASACGGTAEEAMAECARIAFALVEDE